MPQIVTVSSPAGAALELEKIGCDPRGTAIMKDKGVLFAVKLFGLTVPQASIIKQEMLSYGGEAANAYGTINNSIKSTDVLLFGTHAQLKKLVKKLAYHPFSLPAIGKEIGSALANHLSYPPPLKLKNRTFDLKKRTLIMGILNVTPDSFSDGGLYYGIEEAVARGKELCGSGADIIDVGGESTRPGAGPVGTKEEIRRVVPVIKALAREKKCVISVDTRKAAVAEAALKAGAAIVNDVSALRHDRKMAGVIARNRAGVILMHMLGTPRTMQKRPSYGDVVAEVFSFLKERIEFADKTGILPDRVIVDPGFGFGKTLGHNLELLAGLSEFKALGRPVLAGTSRKSMIGKILDLPPEKRIMGTAATVAAAVMNGAAIVRVHDVIEMSEVARTTDAIVRRKK